MKNINIKNTLIFLSLTLTSHSAISEIRTDSPFLISSQPTEILAKGLSGKPPYSNRVSYLKQRKLEKIEISALEVSKDNKKSSYKRKFKHPDSSKRYGRLR